MLLLFLQGKSWSFRAALICSAVYQALGKRNRMRKPAVGHRKLEAYLLEKNVDGLEAFLWQPNASKEQQFKDRSRQLQQARYRHAILQQAGKEDLLPLLPFLEWANGKEAALSES